MKRFVLILMAAAMLLSFAACGADEQTETTIAATETIAPATEPAAEENTAVDLAELYATMAQQMPQMIEMDETMLLNFCGIDVADCVQYAASISYDGLRTDELWLIEAVDEEALDRIEQMAQTRLKMKGEETVSYAPDQYEVVQKAQIIRQGMYLALIVSPDVEALAGICTDAFGQ